LEWLPKVAHYSGVLRDDSMLAKRASELAAIRRQDAGNLKFLKFSLAKNQISQTISARVKPFAAMGWLRSVGSLKLQVAFAEYRLFYRALLQKRRIILRSLLIVATP